MAAVVDPYERAFAAGVVPPPLEGRFRGTLLATTLGRPFDRAATALGRAWMPWLGKAFVPEAGWGINLFTRSAYLPTRLGLPGYRMLRSDGPARFVAFRFRTGVGPSARMPGVDVLRLDYDLPENPSWPIRGVLDEVVEVEPGRYLGQALLRWRGRWARAAWFALER